MSKTEAASSRKSVLALAHQGLSSLSLGDVAHGHDAHGPLTQPALFRQELSGKARPVLAHPGDHVVPLDPIAHALQHEGEVLRRDATAQCLIAEDLFVVPAEHLRESPVGVDHDAVDVDEDPLERSRGEHLESLRESFALFGLDLAGERSNERASGDRLERGGPPLDLRADGQPPLAHDDLEPRLTAFVTRDASMGEQLEHTRDDPGRRFVRERSDQRKRRRLIHPVGSLSSLRPRMAPTRGSACLRRGESAPSSTTSGGRDDG